MRYITKLGSILLGLLMVVQLLPVLSTTAEAATLLLSKDFNTMTSITDDPELDPDQGKIISGVTYRFQDPLGGNNKALRIYTTGDHDSGYAENGSGEWKHRAELRLGSIKAAANVDYWIGYRLWMPNDWPSSAGGTAGVFGAMSGSTPSESNIHTSDKAKLRIQRNWYASGSYQQDKFTASLPTGRWVNVVIHTRRGWNNNGAFEVWLDGVKKTPATWANATTSYDKAADGVADPTFRIGIYFVGDRPGTVWNMYWDDLKIAKGADGYSAVDPAGSQVSAPPTAPTGVELSTIPIN